MSTADDKSAERLRSELTWLRARYDDGAVAPAIYKTIREIETEIAWAEHHANGRSSGGKVRP